MFDYHSVRRQGGALNIRRQVGESVEGYLFAIRAAGDWAALDLKEGHPHRYMRETVTVVDPAGYLVDAQTYRVTPELRQGFVAPHPAYFAICRAGRAHLGLSLTPLERAAGGVPQGSVTWRVPAFPEPRSTTLF